MSALLQFLNRYALLLLPAVLLGAGAVLLVVKRCSWKGWLAWTASCAALLLGLYLLRTPAVTVFAAQPALQPAAAGSSRQDIAELTSPEEIRRLLASSHGRPTLVDFYTDYGIG
jgi:thiol:disulfide interchange protein